jgi:hypothetical protein
MLKIERDFVSTARRCLAELHDESSNERTLNDDEFANDTLALLSACMSTQTALSTSCALVDIAPCGAPVVCCSVRFQRRRLFDK